MNKSLNFVSIASRMEESETGRDGGKRTKTTQVVENGKLIMLMNFTAASLLLCLFISTFSTIYSFGGSLSFKNKRVMNKRKNASFSSLKFKQRDMTMDV